MKRRWTITLLLLPVAALTAAFVTYCSHTVPPSQCDALYLQYKDIPGIKATYLKDYPLDDTTTIAVTLLQAQDSNVWKELYFQILSLDNPDERNPTNIAFKLFPSKNQTQSIGNELSGKDLAVFSKDNLTISFFHLETMQQYLKIFDFYFTSL